MADHPTKARIVNSGAARGLARLHRLRDIHVSIMVFGPFLAFLAAIVVFWGQAIGTLEIATLVTMYLVSTLGIGVGYHRLFTHRAFQTSTPVRAILAIMGATAGQGPVVYWTAVHRRHHENSDREGDPHSPYVGFDKLVAGLWHSHLGWMYRHAIPDTLQYAPDLARDMTLSVINRLYVVCFLGGLAAPAAVGLVVTGTWQGALTGFLWGGLVRVFLASHVIWSVNSICHIYGARPYASGDKSTNNALLAIPSLGESWHNNHHAFPTSAYHGFGWQLDISGLTIRFLKLCRLASAVKTPSAEYRAKKSLLTSPFSAR